LKEIGIAITRKGTVEKGKREKGKEKRYRLMLKTELEDFH